MRRRTRALVLGAMVVGFVGVLVFQALRTGSGGSQFLWTLDIIPANGLVAGQVIGPSIDGPSPKDGYWPVVTMAIEYDRGPYYVGPDGGFVTQPLPMIGDEFVVQVMGEVELEEGATYLFYVDRPVYDDPAEQERWPWRAILVLEGADPFAPVAGTPNSLSETLEAVRLEGESRKDALVAFAREHATFQDSAGSGGDPVRTDRLLAIDAWWGRDSEIVAWPVDLAQAPPSGRQLPGDLADVAEIERAGLRDAYGVDEWIPWRITLYLDDELIAGNAWLAVLVDETGFFGPYGVSSGEHLLVIDGYGPKNGTLSLITWPDTLPLEVAPASAEGLSRATVRSLDLPRVALPDGATEFERTSVGVAVSVNLRFGRAAIVVPNN